MNILLLDDDESCMMGLASALEPAGYNIEMFTVPEEAVKAYQSKAYDLVITDMKMPGMNGIQVLQALRSFDPEAKVIINTGYGDVDTAIAAVNNGAYAFFGKPVDISELLETLEDLNNRLEVQEKSREDQKQLAVEYNRLKKAYEELQMLLKNQVDGPKR